MICAAAIVVGIVAGVYWIGSEPLIDRVSMRFQKAPADFRFGDNYTRPELWRTSLLMIGDNPMIGVGLGAFARAYPHYDRLTGLREANAAHNDFLQLAAETGAVGVVLATLFLGKEKFPRIGQSESISPSRGARSTSLGGWDTHSQPGGFQPANHFKRFAVSVCRELGHRGRQL
jgi:hypothetical protein